jgi:predicted esterase
MGRPCMLIAACLCLSAPLGPAVADELRGPATAAERAGDLARLRERFRELVGAKEYAEAAEVCRRVIALDPKSAAAHYDLACVLARLEKEAEALAALEKAARLGFDDAELASKDEDLAGLREEKRFREALARIRASDEARVEKGAAIPGVKTLEGAPEGGLRYRLRMAPATAKPRPQRLVIWMHPSGGSMNRVVEPLAPRLNRLGFALLVFTRKDWGGWSSVEVPRLARTLDAVAKIEGISDRRPVLLGFSAGGQLALELWRLAPEGLGGLVLDAAYPVGVDAAGRRHMAGIPEGETARGTPILVFVGSADGGYRTWKESEAEFRRSGVRLTIRSITDRGHEWLVAGDELEALAVWLGDRAAEGAAAAPGASGWRPPRDL